MAKIDKIQVGTDLYDINLPTTATPEISSLSTSGTVTVGDTLTVKGTSNLSNVNCNGNITLPHVSGAGPDGTIKTRYIENINLAGGISTVEFPLTISSKNNLDLNASGLLNITGNSLSITSGEYTRLAGQYIYLSAGGDGQDNYIGMDDEGIRLSNKGSLYLECGNFKTIADNSFLGGIKPWYSTTGASTYNGETSAPSAGTDAPNINIKSAKDGRYYLIETDKNGRAYVNVPWTDTTYSNVATMDGSYNKEGGYYTGYVTLTNNSSSYGKLKIYCKQINTTFGTASSWNSLTFTGVSFDIVPFVVTGTIGKDNFYPGLHVAVADVTKTGCKYGIVSHDNNTGSGFYIIAIQPYYTPY